MAHQLDTILRPTRQADQGGLNYLCRTRGGLSTRALQGGDHAGRRDFPYYTVATVRHIDVARGGSHGDALRVIKQRVCAHSIRPASLAGPARQRADLARGRDSSHRVITAVGHIDVGRGVNGYAQWPAKARRAPSTISA